MAILEMNKISIYGLNEKRKAVLEHLHKSELMEVSDFDAEDFGIGRKETAKSISQFDSYIASAALSLSIIDKYYPEKKGLFSGRIQTDESQYSMASEEINIVNKHIYDIIRSENELKQNEESIGKINLKKAQIEPYTALDIPMNSKGTSKTKIRLGSLDSQWSDEQLNIKLMEAEIFECHFEILSSSKQQTCIWFIYSQDIEETVLQFLRSIGFQEPSFGLSHRTAKKKSGFRASS